VFGWRLPLCLFGRVIAHGFLHPREPASFQLPKHDQVADAKATVHPSRNQTMCSERTLAPRFGRGMRLSCCRAKERQGNYSYGQGQGLVMWGKASWRLVKSPRSVVQAADPKSVRSVSSPPLTSEPDARPLLSDAPKSKNEKRKTNFNWSPTRCPFYYNYQGSTTIHEWPRMG